MAAEEGRFPSPSAFARGIQTSVRGNSAAYGYSVMITSTFAVIASLVPRPAVEHIFLFLAGAVAGFVTVELAVTRGFRHRIRGEPPEVVALGSAFSLFSGGLGVGAGALAAEIIDGGAAWPVGAFLCTLVYVTAVGIEMAFAERLQPPREE